MKWVRNCLIDTDTKEELSVANQEGNPKSKTNHGDTQTSISCVLPSCEHRVTQSLVPLFVFRHVMRVSAMTILSTASISAALAREPYVSGGPLLYPKSTVPSWPNER